jgi:hypothetical protein
MTHKTSSAAATVAMMMSLGGCHSEDSQGTGTAPSASVKGTKIIASEPLDAEPPECWIHVATESFASDHGTLAGTVHVEGDYTRTFAKVSVERPGGGWSGSFNGPREAFLQMLKGHLCTESHVYALKPDGNNDPSKGPVVLTAFDMRPDEKLDIDNFCHATSHVPDAGVKDPELRDHFVMQWVEDVLTTTKWDQWRRSFARDRRVLIEQKQSASELFHTRAAELEAAASALGLPCPTVAEWKKR